MVSIAVICPACGRVNVRALRVPAVSWPNAATFAWKTCIFGIAERTWTAGCVSASGAPAEQAVNSKVSPPINANEREYRAERMTSLLLFAYLAFIRGPRLLIVVLWAKRQATRPPARPAQSRFRGCPGPAPARPYRLPANWRGGRGT